jgi:hypothetical protein
MVGNEVGDIPHPIFNAGSCHPEWSLNKKSRNVRKIVNPGHFNA